MSQSKLCQVCNTSPAIKQCFCTDPWLRLCDACIPQHKATEGTHMLFNFPPATEAGQTSVYKPPPPMNNPKTATTPGGSTSALTTCGLCESKPGLKQVESTWVCKDCLLVIEETKRSDEPQLLSIDPETIKAVLIDGLDSIRAVIDQANSAFNRLILAVHKERVRVIRELMDGMREMEDQIVAFAQCGGQGMNIQRLIGAGKWDVEELTKELRIIRSQADLDEFLERLPSLFTFSFNKWLFEAPANTAKPLRPIYYPIFEKQSCCFHLPSYQLYPVAAPSVNLLLSECTAWNYATEEAIFVCGEPKKPGAFVVSLPNFQISATSPSLYTRSFPGIGKHFDFLYIFGGNNHHQPQRYCERYDLAANTWAAIPNMQFPRSHCWPALLDAEFFLIGGLRTTTAEVFHTGKGEFHTLSLELPIENECFSVGFDKDIYIFLNGYINVWERSTNAEYVNDILNHSDDIVYKLKIAPPLRLGDEVLFCALSIKQKRVNLYAFDLSRKEVSIKAAVNMMISL